MTRLFSRYSPHKDGSGEPVLTGKRGPTTGVTEAIKRHFLFFVLIQQIHAGILIALSRGWGFPS
jgi:hypothetical protein